MLITAKTTICLIPAHFLKQKERFATVYAISGITHVHNGIEKVLNNSNGILLVEFYMLRCFQRYTSLLQHF